MGSVLNVNLIVSGEIVFYGSSKNIGNITTNTAISTDESENLGTINGAVTFQDRGVNTAGGIINGSATFNGVDTNNFGTVNGPQTYDPPLLAQWILLRWSSDEPWIGRQIGTYRVYGREINQNYPYQVCPYPNEGCYTQPELYREEFPNLPPFVIDYANHPEYNNGDPPG